MVEKSGDSRSCAIAILHILIDILNLSEQLAIYFIVKQDDLNEETQQKFFFILFAVGGASSFESCLCHPVGKVIINLLIEVGEYVCYMTILPRTNSLLVAASIFFAFHMILYLINLILVAKEPMQSCGQTAVEIFFTPLRIIVYSVLYELQVLFLFMEKNSLFRADLYEILQIINVFFGIITVQKLMTAVMRLKWPSKSSDGENLIGDVVHMVWHILIVVLNSLVGLVVLIIGMIYSSQALSSRQTLTAYDFAVHIIVIVWYGLSLLLLAIVLGLLPFVMCCFGIATFSAIKLKGIFK